MKLTVYLLILQFSAGALMPRTDFGQLSNLKYLVDHYTLHVEEAKEKNEEFDVFDFIYLHYISPDDHTHDEPVDHNKLPFKSVSSSINFVNQESGLQDSFEYENSFVSVLNERVKAFTDSFVVLTLLQPPK